jgi:hypothetical protein
VQPTDKAFSRLQSLCYKLSHELEQYAKATPGYKSLVQRIRFVHYKAFTAQFRKTKPKFFASPSNDSQLADKLLIVDEEQGGDSEEIPTMNLTELREHIEL